MGEAGLWAGLGWRGMQCFSQRGEGCGFYKMSKGNPLRVLVGRRVNLNKGDKKDTSSTAPEMTV